MFRRISFYALAAMIPVFGAANAADAVPLPGGLKGGDVPIDIWSGFYLGVNGGLGANGGKSKLSMKGVSTAPDALIVAGSTCLDVGCVATLPGTAFGGGQIGYNLQRGSLLFGLEADLQAGSTGTGKTTFTNATNTYSASADSTLDWFGTLRGRLGMVYNDTSLIYFTGGLAFGSASGRVTAGLSEAAPDTDTFAGSASNSSSKTLTGYVLGGGIEHAFTPSWSMKAEYQYLQLGKAAPLTSSVSDTLPDDTTTATLNSDHNYHTLRMGLNYHIHPGYGPLN
jgi:outer membrane immunogenic protein